MIHPHSPFYDWDPDSLGWLRRRHEEGEPILAADVVRLVNADPAHLNDPLLQDYVRRVLNNQLPPPRGRPSHGRTRDMRLMVADILLDERAEEIVAERKRAGLKPGRVLLEPRIAAADEIGPYLGLPSGRSLLNQISAWKTRMNKMKARPGKR